MCLSVAYDGNGRVVQVMVVVDFPGLQLCSRVSLGRPLCSWKSHGLVSSDILRVCAAASLTPPSAAIRNPFRFIMQLEKGPRLADSGNY